MSHSRPDKEEVYRQANVKQTSCFISMKRSKKKERQMEQHKRSSASDSQPRDQLSSLRLYDTLPRLSR
jgi:hypothetical protein